MIRVIPLALASCVIAACIGVGDSLVSVRGKIEDQKGQPYERCNVSLTLTSDDEPLDSLWLEGDELEDREMKVSFHVPGRWKDCFISVECEGAQRRFTSKKIGRERPIPLDLGKIVLERQP